MTNPQIDNLEKVASVLALLPQRFVFTMVAAYEFCLPTKISPFLYKNGRALC